jgi:Bacterial SH3 domain
VSGGRRSWRAAAWLLTGLTASAALHAESLYVIEQLVVGVSSAPDASGERVATLKSGDRVEVIERAGDEVHVRLSSGREGWVRASYLSADEPLRARLAQREAEVARLGDELSRLRAQLHAGGAASAASRATGDAAGSGAAAAPAASAPGGSAPADAAAADPGITPGGALFSAGEERPRPLWPWTFAAALIGFGIGFGLGALMLDRHIRRKYGGLRIY